MNYISIKKNEETKHIWDVEENEGFIIIDNYKVKNSPKNNKNASYLLSLIDEYIQHLIYVAHQYYQPNPNLDLLINTQYSIQEILPGDFEGINKPKYITQSLSNQNLFKKDNQYRAQQRHIMLTIRNKNNSLRSWKKIKKLLLHELSHTMANHIVYREQGNHEDDFHQCEKLLTSIATHQIFHIPETNIINFIHYTNKYN